MLNSLLSLKTSTAIIILASTVLASSTITYAVIKITSPAPVICPPIVQCPTSKTADPVKEANTRRFYKKLKYADSEKRW